MLPSEITSIITAQQQSLHRQQRSPSARTARGEATKILEAGATTAAAAMVRIASSDRAQDKDVIAAAKDILDRNNITKQRDQTSAATVPVAFFAAALTGIAAFAGRDMSMFGDMVDLNDKLDTMRIHVETDDIEDTTCEVIEDE